MHQVNATAGVRGGVASKALGAAMAVVLAMGMAPSLPQQAYAAELAPASLEAQAEDALALAAGTHQGSGKTAFEVTEADRSATLYAQSQDFTAGGTSYVSGGWDAYGSGFTASDCDNFVVNWYKGSVSPENLVEGAESTLGWNDIMSKPKWGTDFSFTPQDIYTAADGTYTYFAVATYGSQTSAPLEFTITVNRGGAAPVEQEYAITSVTNPTEGGSVYIADQVGSAITAAKEGATVSVSGNLNSGYKKATVEVKDASGAAVAVEADESNYYDDYAYTFTMPASAVTVTVAFEAASAQGLSVELAAGNHQGYGDSTFDVFTGNSTTLYVQVENAAKGATSFVEGGYIVDNSNAGTEADIANFKINWYKDSVDEANLLETSTVEWNSVMERPKWTTDLTYTPSVFESAGTYKFYAQAEWAIDGFTPVTSAPFEFTVNVTKPAHSAVTAAPTEFGTVTFADAMEGGNVLTEADEGDRVYIIVDPAQGYEVDSITVVDAEGNPVDVNSYYNRFTMPGSAVTVTVTFSKVYAINVASDIVGGSVDVWDGWVSITDAPQMKAGADVKLEPKANEGYVLKDLKVLDSKGNELELKTTGWDNQYRNFTMPEDDVTVVVSFKNENAFTVFEDDVENGDFTVSLDEAAEGDEVVVTPEPDEGYELDAISYVLLDDEANPVGEAVDITAEGKFAMPASDVMVTVTFKQKANPEPTDPAIDPKPADGPKPSVTPTPAPKPAASKVTVSVPKAKSGLVFNGKAQTGVAAGKGYAVKGGSAKKAGTYTATVTAKAGYQFAGGKTTAKVKYTIAKAANPMKAKAKAKKIAIKVGKSVKAKKAFKVTKAQGKVVYKKVKGNKKITVSKSGKVKVKKGAKKGTYTIKVKVTAKGNANYKAKTVKNVKLKVKVK